MRSGRGSMIDYTWYGFLVIVVANWRLDNAKSPGAMLQEKAAWKPHTFRVADVVRAYIPQVGYFLLLIHVMLYFGTRMYERESTARHSSTAKTIKMKSKKFGTKKYPRPLSCNYFLPDRPYTRSKKEE